MGSPARLNIASSVIYYRDHSSAGEVRNGLISRAWRVKEYATLEAARHGLKAIFNELI